MNQTSYLVEQKQHFRRQSMRHGKPYRPSAMGEVVLLLEAGIRVVNNLSNLRVGC